MDVRPLPGLILTPFPAREVVSRGEGVELAVSHVMTQYTYLTRHNAVGNIRLRFNCQCMRSS